MLYKRCNKHIKKTPKFFAHINFFITFATPKFFLIIVFGSLA